MTRRKTQPHFAAGSRVVPIVLLPALLTIPGIARPQDHGDAGSGAPPTSTLPATAVGGRSIAAAVTPSSVPLGGRVQYTVTIRHAPGDRVQLPRRDTNPFGPCRAVGLPREGTREEGTLVAKTFVFDLVALESTTEGLPPFPVSLVSTDGKVYEIAAPAVPLEIIDPTANEPLAEVKPLGAKGADGKVDPVRPYLVYVRDWTLAWVAGIAAGALLVALLAVLATRWWMRRRRAAVPAGPPPVPPYPAARERLARLRIEGTYARMGPKAFHVEMAEAVREYLGRRQEIDATEMTSEELLKALASRPMGSITNVEMELFLSACDFVKFAKAEPHEREALDTLAMADRIVEEVERAMLEVEMRRAAEAAARAAAQAAEAGRSATTAPESPASAAAPANFAPAGTSASAGSSPVVYAREVSPAAVSTSLGPTPYAPLPPTGHAPCGRPATVSMPAGPSPYAPPLPAGYGPGSSPVAVSASPDPSMYAPSPPVVHGPLPSLPTVLTPSGPGADIPAADVTVPSSAAPVRGTPATDSSPEVPR